MTGKEKMPEIKDVEQRAQKLKSTVEDLWMKLSVPRRQLVYSKQSQRFTYTDKGEA